VAIYIYLWGGDSTLIHKIKDYTAFLSLLVLPTGWLIYQAWRTWWQVYRGGYEPRGFLDHIRETVRVYHQEDRSRTIVDFSAVLGKRVGMRWFAQKEFESVFDPFKNIKSSFGFQSKEKRAKRANCRSCYLHFVEPVSDLILFPNESYDYARSIASARYGVWVSIFGFSVRFSLGVSSEALVFVAKK